MKPRETFDYTPRKLSALIAASALALLLQAAPAEATWPPLIGERQATSFTQAHALIECVVYTAQAGGTCRLMPDPWVTERCNVHNPRLPFRLWIGSWGACPFRWWHKTGSGQRLHGCHFLIRRSPPTYKLRGACRPGSRFP